MNFSSADFEAIRSAIAEMPQDISHDAIGFHAPKLDEIYAPAGHSAALDPNTPVVQGSRGAGKSFWSGVLLDDELRSAAATAYPNLGLSQLHVRVGFSGIGGPFGIDRDKLDSCLAEDATREDARAFFWATILHALDGSDTYTPTSLKVWMSIGRDPARREEILGSRDDFERSNASRLLIVYDALDTIAISWPRRRMLTEALLEVVWAMRAFRCIRLKLFIRPDQIEDDTLRFVELPKLRSGAVRLLWSGSDLYGLFFSRLAQGAACSAFDRLLAPLGIQTSTREEILTRRWPPTSDVRQQEQIMAALAGPFMAEGKYGHRKGKTYDWPIRHLGDAFGEVTPRSFLGLLIAAAKTTQSLSGRVFTSKTIQHGLRTASKTRVDQLQQELPWIKSVLAPLSGILLPQQEDHVYEVWRQAGTVKTIQADAEREGYLPPANIDSGEQALFTALEKVGVMWRRKDDRLDMPDLFRVAARLLKKGGLAPS